MKFGLLVSSNLLPGYENTRVDAFEFDEQLASLRSGFETIGLSVDPVLWDDAETKTDEFDAFLEGAQERLQEALILAEPGDTVELAAGRYALTEGLSLDVDGIGWVQHRSDIILRKDANLHCQV